jgi:hypothetical protein
MEFKNLVTRETSDLVGRLVSGVAEKSSRDFQALRHALDLVTEAVDTAIASERRPDYREELAKLVERLDAEAMGAVHAAAQQAQREAQETVEQLRRELADASGAREAAQAQRQALEAQVASHTEQINDLQRAKAEAERAIGEHETQRKDLLAQVAAGSDQMAELRRGRKDAERAAREVEAKLQTATAAVSTLRQRAEAAERETARVRAEAELAAQGSVRAARALEEAEARGARKLAEQSDAIGQHATAFLSMSLDRLLATYLSVASSTTVDDMLTALVEALAVQFSRVALFRVQTNHLEGVRQLGFDLGADISQVAIPRSMDALVTQAVASSRIETASSADAPPKTGMPFGGTPAFALALPIVLDGQSVAVVYADDADQPHREFAKAEIRLKYAQLLHCHAIPLLTRVAEQAKASAELSEYATLLLHELEQTYSADGQVSTDERLQHLRDNIDYARQLYAQRAATEGPRVAAFFEQQLLAAAEMQGDTPFGRDIGTVVGDGVDAASAGGKG